MTGWITVGCILVAGGFGWWRCAVHRYPRALLVRGVV